MYYPIVLTIIFGSQMINLINKEKEFENLERRYKLKINKIDELIEKLRNNEIDNIDIDKELELVNKLFRRQSNTYFDKDHNNEDKINKTNKDLIEDQDNILKLLGLENIDGNNNEIKNKDNNKLNQTDINQRIIFEKEIQNFKIKPETHTIVEIPGDYVDAAKDTKITKFL
ncbi:hypothetical protein WICMUC_001499 [Wickerhamomyces mucosus]|uniref:Uncharacterized protein n=1 Tax=Wickerhamomyces mucosus TaxID=1378264 RepID=A0A9P8PU75_9ASCO|nr:hypothetical protein WICMUC_001499 [Wickerhamomyces mucosus]